MQPESKHYRIGLSGTGFIARSFLQLVEQRVPDLSISSTLTRRDPATVVDWPLPELLTRSIDECVARSDLIVECTGDPIHATAVVERAVAAGVPVVTMNAEFHVTTGSYFVGKGLVTEAEGDQPGSLAALHESVREMGFEPLVLGNMKGFLNTNPAANEMAYWAQRQGISVTQTTAATDGTKIQIEQAFVANGLGGTIARRGMHGPARDDTIDAAKDLAAIADQLGGTPIADYLLSGSQMPGVFIAARHDDAQAVALQYFKLGPGPYYVIFNPHHLCSLEIVKTIRRVQSGGGVLLDNSAAPTVGVAAVTKRELTPGNVIETALGGFDVRGEAVLHADEPDHVPIGLLSGARLRRRIAPGATVRFEDVDIPESRALEIVHEMRSRRVA